MYELPKYDVKEKTLHVFQSKVFQITTLLVVIGVAVVVATGGITLQSIKGGAEYVISQIESNLPQQLIQKPADPYVSRIDYEQAIIDTVKNSSPAVVSIIISKDLPVYTQEYSNPFGPDSPFDFLIPQQVPQGTEEREVGAGSGFIVSTDGLVLTNKHVVSDKAAEYTVLTNDGKKYSAKVLALDPVQDLAIIKIENGNNFPTLPLGNSDGIQIGQGAIAIGNALGQFDNTVSVGVISGLQRTISASDQAGNFSETLEGIIQTDAAINFGNSGGPLLNLKGEVIGVNTATAQGGQSIGFAIPINIAAKDLNQVMKTNAIHYPFLGVRYVIIDEAAQKKYSLPVAYGAYVLSGTRGEEAVTKGSAAEKAGIAEKDIIIEFNGEKITTDNSMAKIIQKYNPGDRVNLKILRNNKEMNVEVVLGER